MAVNYASDMSEAKQVFILPWLSLKATVEFGPVKFRTISQHGGNVSGDLSDTGLCVRDFDNARNFFCRVNGKAVDTLTIGTYQNGSDIAEIREKLDSIRLLLYLACAADNQFCQDSEPFAHSAYFDGLLFPITDGSTSLSHTSISGTANLFVDLPCTFRFAEPFQCRQRAEFSPDQLLLSALVQSFEKSEEWFRPVLTSLPFYSLATTDSPFQMHSERILFLAAAFEQLLCPSSGSAVKIALEMSKRMKNFHSSMTAKDLARYGRSAVKCAKEEYQSALDNGPVSQAWIYELHQQRSKVVHRGPSVEEGTSWKLWEHILMGTFVYPLLIKLLLEKKTSYQLSEDDQWKLRAVDYLLLRTDWKEESSCGETVWSKLATGGIVRFVCDLLPVGVDAPSIERRTEAIFHRLLSERSALD